MNRTIKHFAVAGSMMLALASCAQEREAINRVQPDVVSKSFFVGDNLVDISDDPEFYMGGTIIDVGWGAEQDGLFTSSYGSQLTRIRWEVTEHYLNARLAYERIAGSDGKGNQWNGTSQKTTNDGQIVASFAIQSHFDISRSYNPTTGEELNILEENNYDRPWYEREYMRVDWSQNLATGLDYDILQLLGIYGGVEYTPVSYTVTDPSDADAPVYDDKNGYLDVTNKVFAKPGMIDLSHLGWGIDTFPACFLPGYFIGGTEPYGNCNASELTVRLSFKKVEDSDYEPKNVDGYLFQAFGMFYTDYRGYDRNYGMLDSKWFRLANRYNIWERSHYYEDPAEMTGWVACATSESTANATGNPGSDPNRDEDNDGTADECAKVTELTGVPGSQCDIFKQRCTLPYRLREPKTITWYITDESDPDLELFDTTNKAIVEWDMALKTAVQTGRLVECIRSGAKESACREQFPMWHGQQDDNQAAARISYELNHCRRTKGWDNEECLTLVDQLAADLGKARGDDSDTLAIAAVLKINPVLVGCHSPVVESDPPACGEVGTVSRPGDLRYNHVNIIKTPQIASPWGIMVDSHDPLTGEVVSASINDFDYVTDSAAAGLIDYVRYVNGEISTADITNGSYIRNWAAADALADGTGVLPLMNEETVNARLAAVSNVSSNKMSAIRKAGVSDEIKALTAQLAGKYSRVGNSIEVSSVNMANIASRKERARGSVTEAALYNRAIYELAGLKGGVPSSGMLADMVSPLAANDVVFASQLSKIKENALAKRGACIMAGAPEPSTMIGMAKALNEKFPKADNENETERINRVNKMSAFIHRQLTYGTLAHEMGHSLGSRHNFVSSSAPLFYRPQYWQLRTKNGTVKTICDKATDNGESCVGPRYYDPMTQEETDNMLMMFTQSSIMDYAGDMALDFLGIGVYDVASIRSYYTDVMSVYSDSNINPNTNVGLGMLATVDNWGGIAGIKYQEGSNVFHYSELQKRWNLIKDCYSVEPKQPSWWREELDGKYNPLLDGLYVKVNGEYTECRQLPVDYVSWNDLTTMGPVLENRANAYRAGPAMDGMDRIRVPYSFISDERADMGNGAVYRHDMGADMYEIATYLISQYENRHIFENYRRGRSTFNVASAAARSYGRYNEKLMNIATGMGFMSNVYKEILMYNDNGLAYDDLWPAIVDYNYRDNAMTSSIIFDHFVRMLTRPEAGPHVFNKLSLTPEMLAYDESETKPTVIIPNGSTGYLQDVGFGGRPLESAYDDNKGGEYQTDYPYNCGSYYDKILVAELMSLSEDRFVSDSRDDFFDARWRANGMADVYPEGFRRVFANALTNDYSILAPVIAADDSGNPLLDATASNKLDADAAKYPARPIGWKSFWTDKPEICFSNGGRQVCSIANATIDAPDVDLFGKDTFNNVIPVDPQIGWEVQKFLIAKILANIPANSMTNWTDMMSIYVIGQDNDPEFKNRIEWQDPNSGTIFVARTYGKECLFGTGNDCTGGKIVEKGIAARVLEYANELTAKGYILDEVNYPASAANGNKAGFNEYGRAMYKSYSNGVAIVKADAVLRGYELYTTGENFYPLVDCSEADFELGNCEPLSIYKNRAAYELNKYKSVPQFMRQAMADYGIPLGGRIGIYNE